MTYSKSANFTPWLLIGIGETQAFFTLRETYLHAIPGPGPQGNAVINGEYQGSYVVRSRHLFNLSQDADEAYAKAKEISLEWGYELKAKPETLKEEMREIKRASAEDRERKEREAKETEDRWAREREERELALRDQLINDSRYVFGPYKDKEFKDAKRGYITWLIKTLPEFEEGSLMQLTARLVKERCLDLMLPESRPDVYVGTAGKRQKFEVTVIRCIPFEGYYGTTYFTTMVCKETGALLLSKSGSFAANEGEELVFKATVKEHGEYRGNAQTVIQRIAIQKEKNDD